MSEKELFDAASSMSSQLESCIDYLNELRDSNHVLREWGIEEANKVDNLEQELPNSEQEDKRSVATQV